MHRLGFASCCPALDIAHKAVASRLCKSGSWQSSQSRLPCYGWLGTQSRVQAGYELISRLHPAGNSTVRQTCGKAQTSLATIFKSTFTAFFSTCMAQINCKHQPVVTKGNHCFVALCFPGANEIIIYSSISLREKSPPPSSAFDPVSVLPCCLWWTFDLDSAWSALQCFFRSCFKVGKQTWTVMCDQIIR